MSSPRDSSAKEVLQDEDEVVAVEDWDEILLLLPLLLSAEAVHL
jgi:hypothetical protein